MSEIITGILLILFATLEARFPTILFPSLFLATYILWVLKARMHISHIVFMSFILGVVLDAIDTSHLWLYPFLMPLIAELIIQIKLKVNLTLSPFRITVFTMFVFLLFLPLLLYYNIKIGLIFLRSLFTAFVIEGVLLLLWKGELN